MLSRLLSDIPCQAARGSEGAPSPHIFKIWISNPDDRLKSVLSSVRITLGYEDCKVFGRQIIRNNLNKFMAFILSELDKIQ